MIKLDYYPKNKQHFIRLLEFGQEIIWLFEKNDYAPIVYGSLAMFIYTKNKEMLVEDIDILVPENRLTDIFNLLRTKEYSCKYIKKWHLIQVFEDDLKIEIDSIDYWHENMPIDFEWVKWRDFKFNILSLESLIDVYHRAGKIEENNSVDYQIKYRELVEIKNKKSKKIFLC